MAFLKQRARTECDKAAAYAESTRGDRADNLERAIHHYKQALEHCAPTTRPGEWAEAQYGIGRAYVARIRGDRADNLERAIHHHEQAQKVFSRRAFHQAWAITQNGLGTAYAARIRGDRADNLERAIHHYEQALLVRTRDDFPFDWAMTQNNLGEAYRNRIRGDRADNLERAIHHHEQALLVRTRDEFPVEWATTCDNLGCCYSDRSRATRADDLERAVDYLEQALEIRTPDTLPIECRDTALALGKLQFQMGRTLAARRWLTTAHEAVQALRREAKRHASAAALAERNAELYAHLVACCLREGDVPAAFRYATAGKARAFVDMLASNRLDLSAAAADDPMLAQDLTRTRELRLQIDVISYLILAAQSKGSGPQDGPNGDSSTSALREKLRARQAEEQILWDDLAFKYPALTATQQAPGLSVEQASDLSEILRAPLVEYYRHVDGWCAFLVKGFEVRHVDLPEVDDALLAQALRWTQRIESPHGRGPASYMALERWYHALFAPLESHVPEGVPVVLAPFGPLHLIPLGLARDASTGRYVAQRNWLAFAPALAALRVVLEQAQKSGKSSRPSNRALLVSHAGTPGTAHFLPNVLSEAESIAAYFSPSIRHLQEEAASPNNVIECATDRDVVHFGCHAQFDMEQPEQSGLMLAGGWLTVRRIITELRLEEARVATLAACVTGRAAIRGGDEHVGLVLQPHL